jgi:hypothetical protein
MNKRLDYFRQVEAEAEVTCALDQLVVDRTVLQRFAKVLIPQNEASHGRYKGPIFPITAVVISHRLSTLGNVDEIIVLKDGRVAERGTFRELKRQGGLFSGFLAEQNRYNLDRTKSESIIRPTKMRWQENADEATVIKRPQQSKPAYAQQACLCVEIDGKVIGHYQLDKSKPMVTIGRLAMNDIVVPSRSISRMHARLRLSGDMWLIEDTESLNGLMYCGDRVDQHTLMNGDCVLLAPKAAVRYITA